MMLPLTLLALVVVCANAMVCMDDACSTVKCATVNAENCADGRIVKNGGYCDCCDLCVRESTEGTNCLPINLFLLGVPPTDACAAGFVCDPVTATCKKSVMTCIERKQQIESASNNGVPLLGRFKPQCADDGSYAAKQFKGSVCYCVDSAGMKIKEYTSDITHCKQMNCNCARDMNANLKTGLLGKMFNCASNGNYNPIQCEGSECFCVDDQGKKKANTNTDSVGNAYKLEC